MQFLPICYKIRRSSYLKYGAPDPAGPRAPKSGGSADPADPVVPTPLDEATVTKIACLWPNTTRVLTAEVVQYYGMVTPRSLVLVELFMLARHHGSIYTICSPVLRDPSSTFLHTFNPFPPSLPKGEILDEIAKKT